MEGFLHARNGVQDLHRVQKCRSQSLHLSIRDEQRVKCHCDHASKVANVDGLHEKRIVTIRSDVVQTHMLPTYQPNRTVAAGCTTNGESVTTSRVPNEFTYSSFTISMNIYGNRFGSQTKML